MMLRVRAAKHLWTSQTLVNQPAGIGGSSPTDTLLKQEGLQLAEASWLSWCVCVGFRLSQPSLSRTESLLNQTLQKVNAFQCWKKLEGISIWWDSIDLGMYLAQQDQHGLFPAGICAAYHHCQTDPSTSAYHAADRKRLSVCVCENLGYQNVTNIGTIQKITNHRYFRSEVWLRAITKVPNLEVSNTHRNSPHPLILSLGNKPGWEFHVASLFGAVCALP